MVAMIRLFSGILRTGHFLRNWKMSRVIAIPKAGKDPRLAMNQRPIMLLSHIVKLFELDTQLRSSRQESSTIWPPKLNRGRRTVGIFLDIEKACDRVWHPGLLYKFLKNTQISSALVRTVASFLKDWLDKWCVVVNVTKTAAILTGQQRTIPPKLRFRGQDVDWQTKVQYLGVQNDRSMRMALKWKLLWPYGADC
ncbi:RNA-directed DNA polymerase from mobile element jockey [Eumeta japonica]|uniref:RNA-directed DNA polymerase from mobile element jockey n=1 Tax=Eumeta variegata TaxID=151549 RepID=A0A4C1Z7X9_EUMVA|nr:RNA-directed DNA polymerase from mobile element jockey [Eumeta japonica]